MERMDRARWLGGLGWIVIGTCCELGWWISGGRPGVITAVLILVMLAAATARLLSRRSGPQWWAARTAATVLGIDLWGSVADRFGLLGAPGHPGVSWGTWASFVHYTGQLVPWFPSPAVPALLATTAEVLLGLLLIAGVWWRWVGKATAGLLTIYLAAMLATVGFGAVARYAVPILIGGALVASARGPRTRPESAGPSGTDAAAELAELESAT